MSVQQKLLECETALNSPVDCESHLDAKINHMLKLIVEGSNTGGDLAKAAMLLSPAGSSNITSSGIGGSQASSLNKNNSNKELNTSQVLSIESKASDANNNQLSNIDSIINSVKSFKIHAQEIEKGNDIYLFQC